MDSHHHRTNNIHSSNNGHGSAPNNHYNNIMNRTDNGPPQGQGQGQAQGRQNQQGYGHYDGGQGGPQDGRSSYSSSSSQLNQGGNYRDRAGGQGGQYDQGHQGQGYGHGRQNQHQNQREGGGGGGNQDLNYDPRFYSSERRSPGGHDSDQSIEGLLPPLKQLDIHQIPPDILAYLLKSTRIDQLVANTSNAQQNQQQNQHQQQQQQQQHQQQQRPGSGGSYGSRSSPPASMHNTPGQGQGSNQHQAQPLMRSPNMPSSTGPHYNSSPNNEWSAGPGPGDRQNQGQGQGRNASSQGQGQSQGQQGYGNPNRGQQQQQQQQQHRQDSNHWGRDQHSYNPRSQFGKSSSSSTGGGGGGSWAFSPGAKEFVPRSPNTPAHIPQYNPKYQNQPHHQQSYLQQQQLQQQKNYLSRTQGHPSQTYGSSGDGNSGDPMSWSQADMDSMRGPKFENYMLNQFDLQGGSASDFDTDVDCVLETVTDTINQLALNPADFHRASRRTVDVLKKYLNDVDTLGVIVTLIFEQSVSNSNFCYSGAKLCQVFNKHEIAVGGVTFKNLLLQRCQEEFTSCLQSMGMDMEMEKRSPGLILFFAELYLNFFVEIGGKSVKNMLFGSAALELMTKLVSIQPVTEDHFKCVFRTLKLIGWDLDHESHAEIKRDLEKLLGVLRSLKSASSPAEVEPKVKEYVDILFDLRNKNWNKGSDDEQEGETAEDTAGSDSGAIQYYELPDTVDEDDDDYSSLLIDDEPEEVRRAYEDFLKQTANLN